MENQTQTSTNQEIPPKLKADYYCCKRIFENYSRMKLEITMLESSIKFQIRNMQQDIDEDIYNRSVSHPSENSGGSCPNVSVNKIPSIAESIDDISDEHYSRLSALKFKYNLFKQATESIDIFVNRLEETDVNLLKLRYMNDKKKSFAEISEILNYSENGVKKKVKKLILMYAKVGNYDYGTVISTLC